MRLLPVILLFPLLELGSLIVVGQLLGFWPTLALLLGAGFIGLQLLQGKNSSAQINRSNPMASLSDGLLLRVAGILLLIPGFLTDLLAVFLLVPAFRRWVLSRWLSQFAHLASKTRVVDVEPVRPRPSTANAHLIEGEYQRKDD